MQAVRYTQQIKRLLFGLGFVGASALVAMPGQAIEGQMPRIVCESELGEEFASNCGEADNSPEDATASEDAAEQTTSASPPDSSTDEPSSPSATSPGAPSSPSSPSATSPGAPSSPSATSPGQPGTPSSPSSPSVTSPGQPSSPSATSPSAPSTPSATSPSRPSSPSDDPTVSQTETPPSEAAPDADAAPETTPPEAAPDADAAPETASLTISELVGSSQSFEILTAALDAADMTEVLAGDGPYTVFLPTDEAFEALPEGALQALLEPENKELLTQVLSYHVVPGAVTSTDLTDGEEVTTVEGEDVTIGVSEEGVTVNDANVILADVEASNGIIHVLDEVIIPPAAASPAPESPAEPGDVPEPEEVPSADPDPSAPDSTEP